MAVESAPITIEALRAEHWPGVARVYEEGIATRNATFEYSIGANSGSMAITRQSF